MADDTTNGGYPPPSEDFVRKMNALLDGLTDEQMHELGERLLEIARNGGHPLAWQMRAEQ